MIVVLVFLILLVHSLQQHWLLCRCGWKSFECYRDVVVTLPQLVTDNRVGRGRHFLKLERPRLQHEQWLGFVSISSLLFPSPQEDFRASTVTLHSICLWECVSNANAVCPSRVFGQTPCWRPGRSTAVCSRVGLAAVTSRCKLWEIYSLKKSSRHPVWLHWTRCLYRRSFRQIQFNVRICHFYFLQYDVSFGKSSFNSPWQKKVSYFLVEWTV